MIQIKLGLCDEMGGSEVSSGLMFSTSWWVCFSCE